MAKGKVYIANNIFDEKEYYIKQFTDRGYTLIDNWDNADIIFAKSIHNSKNNNENYHTHQKLIYIYPNSEIICNKINLAIALKYFNKNSIIAPKTWFGAYTKNSIHSHINVIIAKLENKYPRDTLFIVKPSNESCGISINVMKLSEIKTYISLPENNLYDIGNNRKKFIPNWIIQEYISNPLLINHALYNYKVKFDIRYNVFMITNVNGEIEFHAINDFAVRISDEKYTLTKLDHLIHVTNISTREQTEHNFKFASAIPELQKHNRIKNVHNFVKNYIIPLLKLVYTPPQNGIVYFARFGIDLMIDANDNVKLIEINRNPGEPITLDCADASIEYATTQKINNKNFTKIADTYPLYYIDDDMIIPRGYSTFALYNAGETRVYNDFVYSLKNDTFNTMNKNYNNLSIIHTDPHRNDEIYYFYYNKRKLKGKIFTKHKDEKYKKIKQMLITDKKITHLANSIGNNEYLFIAFVYNHSEFVTVLADAAVFAKFVSKIIARKMF